MGNATSQIIPRGSAPVDRLSERVAGLGAMLDTFGLIEQAESPLALIVALRGRYSALFDMGSVPPVKRGRMAHYWTIGWKAGRAERRDRRYPTAVEVLRQLAAQATAERQERAALAYLRRSGPAV